MIKGNEKVTAKKQTTEKQKVKKCIKTDRPQRESGKVRRPISNESTATTAKPHKEM